MQFRYMAQSNSRGKFLGDFLGAQMKIVASVEGRSYFHKPAVVKSLLTPEAFPQRVFRLTQGNTGLPWVGFFVHSYRALCY